MTQRQPIDSDVPARLDRLPWSRVHCLLITALGVTWVLNGQEAIIIGATNPVRDGPGRHLLPGESHWRGQVWTNRGVTALAGLETPDRNGERRVWRDTGELPAGANPSGMRSYIARNLT